MWLPEGLENTPLKFNLIFKPRNVGLLLSNANRAKGSPGGKEKKGVLQLQSFQLEITVG